MVSSNNILIEFYRIQRMAGILSKNLQLVLLIPKILHLLLLVSKIMTFISQRLNPLLKKTPKLLLKPHLILNKAQDVRGQR